MGGLSFLLAFLLKGIFDDLPMLVLVVGGTWVATLLLSRRGEESVSGGPMIFTRLGLAAGLVGLMVHMMVDFDFYDPGVATTLFVALGLIAILQSPRVDVEFPPSACLAGAAATLVVALPFLMLMFPRAWAADRRLEDARDLLGGQPSTKDLDEALEAAAAAQVQNPFLAEAFALYAETKFHTWNFLRLNLPPGENLPGEIQPHGEQALLAIQDAIRVRPRHAPYHHRRPI